MNPLYLRFCSVLRTEDTQETALPWLRNTEGRWCKISVPSVCSTGDGKHGIWRLALDSQQPNFQASTGICRVKFVETRRHQITILIRFERIKRKLFNGSWLFLHKLPMSRLFTKENSIQTSHEIESSRAFNIVNHLESTKDTNGEKPQLRIHEPNNKITVSYYEQVASMYTAKELVFWKVMQGTLCKGPW